MNEILKVVLWSIALLVGIFFSQPEGKIKVLAWGLLAFIACLGYLNKFNFKHGKK